MRTKLLAVAATATLLALVAGCTSATSPTSNASPAFKAPVPAGVQDPATIPSAAADSDSGCDPLASLRPPAAMPPPRQMPAGSSMETILKNGHLTVGVDQNTYLFGYRDAVSGQVVGFDIDIAKLIAKAIFGDDSSKVVKLVAITSAQRIPFVQNGTVDIVADSMTINCERLRQVAFSTDYFDAGQKILVRKGSGYTTIDDLAGKKVCAAAGTTSIVTIATRPSHPVPVAVNDWTDCLVMLQQGQVQAVSTDDNILAGLAAQDPTIEVVGPRFTAEPHGLAIKKTSTDFVRFVNGVLDQARADGTWTRLYDKWLGGPAPTPPAAKYSD
ncbi:glutamate ABC transporter substrate-binding protein [Rugosimonospora africana]|uniref:ABC transporter substrate-binding protein n=1 Tax=Rugosimonospora africana TaxID=556532 RepID=A0A8J3QMU1_9ACTN|nr:glutamate ABC transporter substrate-binding protein [Rugosimonospora africana]GIH11946.1 ABC transporter substrate-binding protein [Rugosimonospora africana]